MGIMAVSAYAAKADLKEEEPTAELGAQPFLTEAGTLAWVALDGEIAVEEGPLAQLSVAGKTDAEAAPVETVGPPPTPPAVIRYPAPVEALAVSIRQTGRNNLSLGPRVWPVLSLRPVGSAASLGRVGPDIPGEQLVLMQRVGLGTGIPWQVLAGIAKVESNFGRNMATSTAGAIGYGQFLPATWALYGEGGNLYDFRDVLPAMARFLLAAGAPEDIPNAVFAYNHSSSYVTQVLSYAASYGYTDGSNQGLIWPVSGVITTYFLPGDHLGIDIDPMSPPGMPILAAHDGVVVFAGGDPCCGYGYYVVLVGPSGFTTLYAHLDGFAVATGDTVRQGQALGAVGCTGRCSGPHLHFEVILDELRRNPLDYLP